MDVAQSELLTESELKALQRVEEAFKRLRIELHLLTGRAETDYSLTCNRVWQKFTAFNPRPPDAPANC